MTIFNSERIHQAHLCSGIPLERLARRIGISRATIEAIEAGDDRDVRKLPLAAVERLAELLGLTLIEMFNGAPKRDTDHAEPDANQASARWNRNTVDLDAVQDLAALLLTRTQVVMTSDIINVLTGWDHLKLRHARDAINETPEPLGVRIDLNSNEHRVLPCGKQNIPLDALETSVTSRRGPSIDGYQLAYKAIAGPVPVSKIGFRAQLRHGALASQRIGRLHPETSTFELSTEARIGLMLENP